MLRRIAGSIAGIATLAVIAACGAAFAQSYPARPVKIVVPYTAGGSSDFTARTLAEKLGPLLGGQVVVENKPGGNTLIATELVVKSPPDGIAAGIIYLVCLWPLVRLLSRYEHKQMHAHN